MMIADIKQNTPNTAQKSICLKISANIKAMIPSGNNQDTTLIKPVLAYLFLLDELGFVFCQSSSRRIEQVSLFILAPEPKSYAIAANNIQISLNCH
jgi:hypothetical protein